MPKVKIQIEVEAPTGCDRVGVNNNGTIQLFSENADPTIGINGFGWVLTRGHWQAGRVSNWKDTLTTVSEQQPPSPDERITAAAPALFQAVKYMLNRIHRDPNVQYYCGACTETLRLLSEAYSQATGKNASDVERAAAMADCGEAHVLELKRRVEELEALE